MIFTLAFYTTPIKKKQTLTESERNEDHEMEKISNIYKRGRSEICWQKYSVSNNK